MIHRREDHRRYRWRQLAIALATAVMAIVVVPPLALWIAVHDWRLRRALRARHGHARGLVIIGYRPDTAWHHALVARWMPEHADRTILLDETDDTVSASRSLEMRAYRRWRPDYKMTQPPGIIAIPPRGRTSTVSFARALGDAARGDWTLFDEQLRATQRLAGLSRTADM